MNRRNGIAHGNTKEGFDERTYKRIEGSVFRILHKTIQLIMDALMQRGYLLTS